MTRPNSKKEFMESDEPLVLIVSFNPETEQTMHDYYNWQSADGWIYDFERDFPDHVHFRRMNPAALEARRKMIGLTK